jgi:hypothetical protein
MGTQITQSEIDRRRKSLQFSIGSFALEGIIIDDALLEISERWAVGEITMEQQTELSIAYIKSNKYQK